MVQVEVGSWLCVKRRRWVAKLLRGGDETRLAVTVVGAPEQSRTNNKLNSRDCYFHSYAQPKRLRLKPRQRSQLIPQNMDYYMELLVYTGIIEYYGEIRVKS